MLVYMSVCKKLIYCFRNINIIIPNIHTKKAMFFMIFTPMKLEKSSVVATKYR
ncbi:hypothetical protein VAMP_12n210 [Candidatus Vampirococcus lugosii]|uniref:Uncharacterized protein n=1 Tax=Candidatus Vampirococcus lugosii TaxID=2789015 RepID=A0ABS5QK95_9BACT|nr:hypothetical protein [Candidatus Vampirococcus lugosii]